MTLGNLSDKRLKNREKQSALRQRRKDYVESLEKRLHELQAAGIRATEEVQAAARRVDAENKALRALLREQYALSNDDIDNEIKARVASAPSISRCKKACKTSSCGKANKKKEESSNTGDNNLNKCQKSRPPITTTTSIEAENIESSSSTIPCLDALRMIKSVNVKGQDMKDIMVQLPSCAKYGCGQEPDNYIDGNGSAEGNSECQVNSQDLFKVLDKISDD